LIKRAINTNEPITRTKVQPVKNSTRENKMNIPLAILASAATIGLLADLMLKENFHTNTMVGFGVPALTIALSLATCLFACASKLRTRRHGLGFLIPAVVFSLAFLLRDSPTLLLIDFRCDRKRPRLRLLLADGHAPGQRRLAALRLSPSEHSDHSDV
jgi:hypothetical protein